MLKSVVFASFDATWEGFFVFLSFLEPVFVAPVKNYMIIEEGQTVVSDVLALDVEGKKIESYSIEGFDSRHMFINDNNELELIKTADYDRQNKFTSIIVAKTKDGCQAQFDVIIEVACGKC